MTVEDEDPLQEEDDEVAKTVLVVHGRTLDHTHVQRLTEETFTAQTQSTEGLVVMFYLVCEYTHCYVRLMVFYWLLISCAGYWCHVMVTVMVTCVK